MISVLHIILRTIRHYWRSNLTVIIGIAISTMVLTGTLLVGDSVRNSLEKATELRLGNTSFVFSGIDRYFRNGLANEIQTSVPGSVIPLLKLNGIASAQGGKYKVNRIRVLGIDDTFQKLIPGNPDFLLPLPNEAFISENLANRLQLKKEDAFLLRVEKASLVPKNAPFVSETENLVSIRLKVKKILGKDELGRFNLNSTQTAPFNIFISLSLLNDKMDFQGMANQLLFTDLDVPGQDILSSIHKHWKPEDMGLHVIPVNKDSNWEIRSDRVFIDSVIVNAVNKFEKKAENILTYMANSIRTGDKETPYSFVSAGPFLGKEAEKDDNLILINSWLAEDLDAQKNDSIETT